MVGYLATRAGSSSGGRQILAAEDLQVGEEVCRDSLGEKNMSGMQVSEVPGHRDEDRPGTRHRDQKKEVWEIE